MRAPLAALAVLAATACIPRGDNVETIVEIVRLDDPGARPILLASDVFRTELARLRLTRDDSLDARPLPTELKAYVLQRMIDDILLAQESIRIGVRASTLAVSREMAVLRASIPPARYRRFLSDTYQTEKDLEQVISEHLTAIATLEKLTLQDIKVSEAEVRSAWDALPKEERIRPERIRAAQILVETEAEAVKIWRSLRLRGNFAKLAKMHSKSPEAPRGGDLGWFARGELPAVFDDMCFPLKKKQFSHVTPSEYGYHLCKVLDRENRRPLKFEEVRAKLQHDIETDRVRQAQTQLMARLREQVEITVNKRAFDRVE